MLTESEACTLQNHLNQNKQLLDNSCRLYTLIVRLEMTNMSRILETKMYHLFCCWLKIINFKIIDSNHYVIIFNNGRAINVT